MSATDEEVSITQRVCERPSLELGKVREVRVRDALTLFAAIAALTLGAVVGSIALVLATIAWFAAALLGDLIAWLG